MEMEVFILRFWNWELTVWKNLDNSFQTVMVLDIVLAMVLLIYIILKMFQTSKIKKGEKQEIEKVTSIGLIVLVFVALTIVIIIPNIKKNLQEESVTVLKSKGEIVGQTQYESVIATEDCYLCAKNTNFPLSCYWGEKNVAILDLNTFNFYKIDINRYDEMKNPIEEKAEYARLLNNTFSNGERINFFIDSDRAYAEVNIELKSESRLSFDSLQKLLCSDCLTKVISKYIYTEEEWNIALLNLHTREILPLEKSLIRSSTGDYTVWCNYDEDKTKLNILILYSPNRFD